MMETHDEKKASVAIDVSIIVPVYNAEKWLDECLNSVVEQTFHGVLELSVYNDGSNDRSMDILDSWITKLKMSGVRVNISGGLSTQGVGYAKNRAVEQSKGRYLCFLDSDDVMHPDRIQRQFEAAQLYDKSLIGCQFFRRPDGSTERYTRWANGLTSEQLYTQIYTSHGPTVIMPTWFCARSLFDRVGKFDESGKGTPEDLIFFYEHLRRGGEVHKVCQSLLMYRYHPDAATFAVLEDTIWNIRMKEFQDQVLSKWHHFSIWNAGKQGRHFFRSLTISNQSKVHTFCDVDEKKIAKGEYVYEESTEKPKPRIPIVHFTNVMPPLVICVKQDLTGGKFELNLKSLNLKEGRDYLYFS